MKWWVMVAPQILILYIIHYISIHVYPSDNKLYYYLVEELDVEWWWMNQRVGSIRIRNGYNDGMIEGIQMIEFEGKEWKKNKMLDGLGCCKDVRRSPRSVIAYDFGH